MELNSNLICYKPDSFILNANPTGEDVYKIAQLTQLFKLKLNKDVTGIQFIYSLINLRVLDLTSYENITDQDVEKFSTLKNLVELKFNYQHGMTQKGLNSILQMEKLQTIHFPSHLLHDKDMSLLGQMTNLKNLKPFSNQLTYKAFIHSTNLINLRKLNLHICTRITEQVLQYLTPLTNLQFLNLYSTPLTGWNFKVINSLINLKEIVLSFPWILNGVKFDNDLNFITSLKNLQIIQYLDCRNFSDQALEQISQLTNLQSLQICYMKEGGTKYIHSLSKLEKLILIESTIIDEDLKDLTLLTNLVTLSLSSCKRITDLGIQQLTSLTHLQNLFKPKRITEESEMDKKCEILFPTEGIRNGYNYVDNGRTVFYFKGATLSIPTLDKDLVASISERLMESSSSEEIDSD